MDRRTTTTGEDDKCDKKSIYLDYNGTTPVYSKVLEAMLPFLTDHFGNPSSGHWAGKIPHDTVQNARRQILEFLGARVANDNANNGSSTAPEEEPLSSIWFTSCGTESDNLAIELALQSTITANRDDTTSSSPSPPLPHIVTCNVEHPAIEAHLRRLESQKRCTVSYVPVSPDGRVPAQSIIDAIVDNHPNTVLVTLMLANNESGALNPIQTVSSHCRSRSILFHTDAAQAAGKVDVTLPSLGYPDMVTLVGHKMGAPKGIACLYVRDGCLVEEDGAGRPRSLPRGGVILAGGGQENGRRGGTENVPYIAGFGRAAELARENTGRDAVVMEALRSRLLDGLVDGLQQGVGVGGAAGVDIVRVNGPDDPNNRLPNTLSVGLRGVDSSSLLRDVGARLAASAGAACHSSGGGEISSVLRAMKVPEEYARGTLRLSVGPGTTEEEVDGAVDILVGAVKKQFSGR